MTYRLFDYNRIDKFGNKRLLHVEKALRVCNFRKSIVRGSKLQVRKYGRCYEQVLLCHSRYFNVSLFSVRYNGVVNIKLNENSFMIAVCIYGKGRIETRWGRLYFCKGDTVFVPANEIDFLLRGNFKLLLIEC